MDVAAFASHAVQHLGMFLLFIRCCRIPVLRAGTDVLVCSSPDDDNMVTATNDFNMQKTGSSAVSFAHAAWVDLLDVDGFGLARMISRSD
eukprot:1875061-Rhodomonas_salina.1